MLVRRIVRAPFVRTHAARRWQLGRPSPTWRVSLIRFRNSSSNMRPCWRLLSFALARGARLRSKAMSDEARDAAAAVVLWPGRLARPCIRLRGRTVGALAYETRAGLSLEPPRRRQCGHHMPEPAMTRCFAERRSPPRPRVSGHAFRMPCGFSEQVDHHIIRVRRS